MTKRRKPDPAVSYGGKLGTLTVELNKHVEAEGANLSEGLALLPLEEYRDELVQIAKIVAKVWKVNAASEASAETSKPSEPELTVVELGEVEANYDESIASKIAGNADPKRIGWHNREWATDEKFPDSRKGKKRFKVSAVCFHKNMPQEGEGSVEAWCKDNKKILASPKEGIDLALVSLRPKLDNVMPLAMAGQFFVDGYRFRLALCFLLYGAKRFLYLVWLSPDERWDGHWWFLVLEELPSTT